MFDFLLEKANDHHFLKPLFPAHPMFIAFEYGQSIYCYQLDLEGLRRVDGNIESIDVKIIGNEEQMEELITGQLKLQQLMKLKAVKVEGRFRDILRLESVLSLLA
ncbi:hypothetical protein CX649_06310 [Bacillaceae bacterium ZC4]|jgi:hypothetical protein|uniref:SCP2 sterol-binding domain-containing protein n=1 Tax=unclassified Aeribacillus TaxID=2640495 RepID=UPI00118C267F|nr:hypothetical protein CX649_06310 [Bacillaceae bacterium ZC4]MDR9791984.1 SCP2 sterol-binding domain-containing protein [Aeribacillus pallidus]